MSIRSILLEAMVWISEAVQAEPRISKDAEIILSRAMMNDLAIRLVPAINLTARGYSKAVVFSYADRITQPSVQVRPCRE